MVTLIVYTYILKLRKELKSVSSSNIFEEDKAARRSIILALTSAAEQKGLSYTPAYHAVLETVGNSSIRVDAAEFIGTDRFLNAEERMELHGHVREALGSLGTITIEEDSFCTKQYDVSIDDFATLKAIAHYQMSPYEGILRISNDFDSPLNTYARATDGYSVLIDSIIYYVDAETSGNVSIDEFFNGLKGPGFIEAEEGTPEADESEENDADEDDTPVKARTYTDEEILNRLRFESFHVDKVLAKHIADIPGFRFYRGAAVPYLSDVTDSAELHRTDIVTIPNGVSKDEAYQLIRTAYRTASLDISIDDMCLIASIRIKKSKVRLGAPARFLSDVEAIERSLQKNRLSGLENIDTADTEDKTLVMLTRFRTSVPMSPDDPDEWFSMRLKEASHYLGYGFFPEVMEILDAPEEHGFSDDYEGFDIVASTAVSMKSSSTGKTYGIFINTVVYPGDLTFREAEELLDDVIEKGSLGNQAACRVQI